MITTVFTSLRTGYDYVHKHPQLLMTVLLIVIIPIAFIFSGQQFLNAGKDNQERLEKERIGMMHDVFAAFVVSTNFNSAKIQPEISNLIALNPDITQFVIAREDKDALTIIAGHDESLIGQQIGGTEYRMSNIKPGESIIAPYVSGTTRYWRSYRLIKADNSTNYYIFTETSLAHIDALFKTKIVHAYVWLFAVLLVVLFLIVRHVRMIDYSYLYQQTKNTNEMKDMFTNMIAHELRAPLTAMRGYASMIRQKADISDDARTYATRIEESSERLVTVVSDLLDVARIQSGKMKIEPKRIDVLPVVTSVLEAMRATALEKQIELIQEGETTQLIMEVDSKRLHQALTNLVSNAIKYTPSGSIAIALTDLGKRVEIRVKDTGMGISADNQKSLFAPFFRVKHSEVDAIVGTGLGMLITKQLIELMGGSIGVESIKGVGTHVVITLPK